MGQHRHERGSVSTWLALAAAAMILCVGLAVDLGGHVHAQQRVRDLAAQAARTAASRYLARAGVTGTVHLPAGTTLTVTVNDTYTPLVLTVIGIGPLRVSGQATARLVRAVDGAEG